MMNRCWGVWALALVAACGGSGGGGGEELLGSWVGGSFLGSVTFTFNADGTLVAVGDDGDGEEEEGEQPLDGTWDVDGDQLHIAGLPGEFADATFAYLVHDERLTFAVLYPDGDVDGVVGTWEGETTVNGVTASTRIELASDGTGHITAEADGDGDEAVDADLTWELDVSLLELEYPSPLGGTTISYRYAIPDVALGGLTLVRVAAGP